MKLTRIILAGFLMLPASFRAQEAAPPESKQFISGLAPGDQITVRMYDFPELVSGVQLHIGTDGTVHLPYAGTLKVAGMSPLEAEGAITEALRSKGIVKEPNITVDVTAGSSLSVNVLGQVLSPKSIPLYAPASLVYIVAQAGGVSGLAAHSLTILHRDNTPPTTIDYDPEALTNTVMQTMVQPGDVVTVSSRGVYFITGEVNRPGIYPLGGALSVGQTSAQSGMNVVKNITLLQALAQCGGITQIAARSKMYLLRTVDGKREEIIVDEVKLYKGQIADPILHADDIIYVPSSYIRQQTNNLFGTAISSLYAAIQIRQIN